MPTITLTTDFGLRDAYVAALKGVILTVNPDATIVDICHSIQPQSITQASFLLSTVCGYFPQGTIHTVVVDPGVGSQRRAIILKTREAIFVAPDNGVLSHAIRHASPETAFPEEGLLELPPGLSAVEIANPAFWRHPVSATFHGRDIFAPVAAHLSLGVPLDRFGPAVSSVNVIALPRPHRGAKGELVGHVLHVDGFGNVITDFRPEDLPPSAFHLHISGERIESLTITYADAPIGQLLALIGSSGYLEICVRNGSAAGLLGVRIGEEVNLVRG